MKSDVGIRTKAWDYQRGLWKVAFGNPMIRCDVVSPADQCHAGQKEPKAMRKTRARTIVGKKGSPDGPK